MHNKALIRVKVARHPVSDDIIGFRLEAAIPNMVGRVMLARRNSEGDIVGFYAKEERSPSFRSPYLIRAGSDHSYIDQKKLDRFKDELRWQGFKEFELVGKYLGEAFADQFE